MNHDQAIMVSVTFATICGIVSFIAWSEDHERVSRIALILGAVHLVPFLFVVWTRIILG